MSRVGDRTGTRNAYTWSQTSYRPSDRKRVIPRCTGPESSWCPVEGCEVVHPLAPLDVARALKRLVASMWGGTGGGVRTGD